MDSGVEKTRILPKEYDIRTDTRDTLARATQYADERNFKDWLIVDTDAHHSELSSWKEVVLHIEDPVLRHNAIEMQQRTGAGRIIKRRWWFALSRCRRTYSAPDGSVRAH